MRLKEILIRTTLVDRAMNIQTSPRAIKFTLAEQRLDVTCRESFVIALSVPVNALRFNGNPLKFTATGAYVCHT